MITSTTKTGYKTTEFYLTLLKASVGPVMAIAVAGGYLSPDVTEDEIQGHINSVVQGAIALIALFVSGSVVKTYTTARTKAKDVPVAPVKGTHVQ